MAGGCLEDERLAAFVDGSLPAGERAEVERHLASCRTCFAVYTETVKTVQAMEAELGAPAGGPAVPHAVERPSPVVPSGPARKNRIVRWAVSGGGLAAAAAIVLALWWPRPERPELVDLVAAVGERRPVEGRLTGGFRFGPIDSPTRGTAASADWRVLAATARLEESTRGRADARLLGALGTARLVAGDLDGAIALLDRALLLAPDDALLRSDRAAALVARGDARADRADFERALDDAGRALASRPDAAEARFNRAIALERLERTAEARAAWADYLAIDGTSPWAEEARRHASTGR
jgi:hypothetical protein